MRKRVLKQFLLDNFWLLVVLVFGTIAWSLTMIKSGITYPFGMGFWGANGHDGIWHIALSESLAGGSFSMPTFSGARLQNYHIGFDVTIALFNRLTGIPIHTIYFQVFPPILALLIGVLVYLFVINWRGSKVEALWSTFFVYFGGGLGFVIGKGESAFWSQQAISTLINPPFALSLVITLLGLICLIKKKYVLATILFGILLEVKVYAGILVLGGLLVSKQYKVFLGSLVISLLLFIPLNKSSGRLLVFQPFWFLETMMGLSDRIGWQRFYSAMTNYKLGGFWWKWIPVYLVAFGIFCVGNLGTRVIFLKKLFDRMEFVKIFVLSIIFAGIAIPMLFLQKGTPWNTIQFFYYSIFFSAILAGPVVSQIKSKIVTMLIILLTIPTSLITLFQVYIPSRPPAKISNEELSALKFLRKQPKGTVLTYPFDEFKAKEAITNPPRPLYLYDSTAYVSALSAKPVYLEDQVNLDITGYAWQERREKVVQFILSEDENKARNFLTENNIKYLYLVKAAGPLVDEELKLGPGQLLLTKIFENKEVDIYKVE